MIPPFPIVLIAGFLGAGKTTFLHALLPLLAARGLAPYVFINDYRNAEVDASGLRVLTGDVRAINGDCICCDSLDELIVALLDIHATTPARRAHRSQRHQRPLQPD